ncbi:MAG TPA: hypothetical protein VFK32_00845 [Tepidiformaceae bacterium]|nr:hypothetical protein [Tepidiformaceae bacterium]
MPDDPDPEATLAADALRLGEARAAGGRVVSMGGVRVAREVRDAIEEMAVHMGQYFRGLIGDLEFDPVPMNSEPLSDDEFLRRLWSDGDRVLYEVSGRGESVTVWAIVREGEE